MAEVLTLNTLRELTTTLEATIVKLTRETPSGGSRRIGDASFTVRYCSDIWEWEYQGETFWDARDLAESIVRGRTATFQKVPLLYRKTKAKVRLFKTKLLLLGSLRCSGRLAGEVFSDR